MKKARGRIGYKRLFVTELAALVGVTAATIAQIL